MGKDRHASRASFACARCQRYKRRCDISKLQAQGLDNPSCSACRNKNEKCEVRYDDKRSSRQTHHDRELRQRIAALEEIIQKTAHSADNTAALASSTPQAQPERSLSHAQGPSNRHTATIPSPSNSGSPQSQVTVGSSTWEANPSHQTNQTELLSATTATNPTRPTLLSASVSHRRPDPTKDSNPRESHSPQNRPDHKKSQAHQQIQSVRLFPYSERQFGSGTVTPEDEATRRARADLEASPEPEPIILHLLDLFWEWQASHLLVVSREVFLHHRKIWDDNNGQGNRNFYTPCLLYSILSLSSMISPDKGVRKYSAPLDGVPGELFCKRARALLDLEMERPTVTTVQAALILGSRYGAMVDNSLGWIYSGIALRISSKLGLHLDCSKAVAMGLMDEETVSNRLTTFWGCFIEDNLFSAYCHRPTFFKAWDITAPLPQARLYSEPGSTHTSSSLLHTTATLSVLYSKILAGLYGPKCDDTPNQLSSLASQLHKDLWRWHHDLPKELIWAKDGLAPLSSQIFVLHMHFYFALILLYRRFLRFSQAPHDLNNLVESTQNPTIACTIAAINITKLIGHFQAYNCVKQVPAPIVHTLFIAGSIHLVNFCLTKLESYKRSLQIAVDALSEIGDSYPMAHKAASTLEEWSYSWKSSADMEKAVDVTIVSHDDDEVMGNEQDSFGSMAQKVSPLTGMEELLGSAVEAFGDQAVVSSSFELPTEAAFAGQWMPEHGENDPFVSESDWLAQQTWLESIYGNASAINF